MNSASIAVGVFLLVYMVIISEKVNRMVVAFFGVALILMFKIMDLKAAVSHVDPETLILLLSMMIIVNITKETGVFEYAAIKIAKVSNGSVPKIMIMFSLFTAVSSAFLDNVTTILLVAPVTVVIAKTLSLNPAYLIIPEVMLANIGGTATLIGDPPNIMIGSKTGLGFVDFITALSPVVLVVSVLVLSLFYILYRKHLKADKESWARVMNMDEKLAIKNKALLTKCTVVLVCTIIGFLLGHAFGFDSAAIAFMGSAILMLISKLDPEEIMLSIEWTTLFFFAGLFILVGALEEVGVIEKIAQLMMDVTGSNIMLAALVILWGSAIASAFLDNIPFVATMIPLITSMGAHMHGIDITPLWWALALGACLGGNGTIMGASANVIASGILQKERHKLSFVSFMKVGMPVVIISILVSSAYLMLRYF